MSKAWSLDFGADDNCAMRLICFAHAGGGPSAYANWARIAPGSLAVSAAYLPGREGRFREPNFCRMEELITPLMQGLIPQLDRPFLLFGHSFGAIVAFEIARCAIAAGLPLRGLVASGRRAPHLAARRAELHTLEPEALVDALCNLQGTPSEILGDASVMEHFLPSLRADLQINETYRPLPGGTLTCPVFAMMGQEDTEVNETELLAWREVTSGLYYSKVFPGGHFYLKNDPSKVFEFLNNEVMRQI